MSSDVVSIAPSHKVVVVAEVIFSHGFHGLPVVEGGKVVGIITENDFFIKDSGMLFLPSYINFLKETRIIDDIPAEKKKKIKKLLSLEARDIMTPDPITVPLDMEVEELLELIKKTRFNTLPVTDEEKNLLGIVTLVDVIGMVKQSRDMENYFKPKEADDLVREVHPWWKKTFVAIKKVRVRSWKFIFATAFIAGAIAAIIWMVSVRVQTRSGAEEKSAKLFLVADDQEIGEEVLFNVDVNLDTDGQKVNAVESVINYDPREFKLEIWDTDGSIFSPKSNCQFEKNPCKTVKNDPEKGQITIYLASPAGIAAEKEKIANLVFRTRRSSTQTFPVSKDINIDSSSGVYIKKRFLHKDGEKDNVLASTSGVSINVIHPQPEQ
jgi:CBS domain-containing protein